MKKILILFAHPAFHKSRINKQLLEAVSDLEGVTINNLYENYPDFFINVKREQYLLRSHDVIIWHHPFYWYSAPAIIKEWMDLVLEHGFAYGADGHALDGKKAMSVISTGGKKEVYTEEGRNQFTINQFLAPYNQTANLCRMTYLPPLVLHGSHTILQEEIKKHAKAYRYILKALINDSIKMDRWLSKEYSNELIHQYA